jgi:hypothetical protein
MNQALLDRLQRRARSVRMRGRVRAWEYRQRNLASGVWFRLRRVLADARDAYAISNEEARALIEEGYRPEPCGGEISPGKTLIFVDEARLARIEGRAPIRVGLDQDFLAASAVALVAFEGVRRHYGR